MFKKKNSSQTVTITRYLHKKKIENVSFFTHKKKRKKMRMNSTFMIEEIFHFSHDRDNQ
jgi:hypothetical protein